MMLDLVEFRPREPNEYLCGLLMIIERTGIREDTIVHPAKFIILLIRP